MQPRPPDHLRPHRVAFNIHKCPPEMHVVQRTRVKPSGPEVSGAAVEAIDVDAVPGVGGADGPGQAVGGLGRQHEVNVIGHQTVAVNGHVEAVALLAEGVEVETAIIVDEEDGLLIVAAMGDVMRRAGHDDAGDAGHGPMNTSESMSQRMDYTSNA